MSITLKNKTISELIYLDKTGFNGKLVSGYCIYRSFRTWEVESVPYSSLKEVRQIIDKGDQVLALIDSDEFEPIVEFFNEASKQVKNFQSILLGLSKVKHFLVSWGDRLNYYELTLVKLPNNSTFQINSYPALKKVCEEPHVSFCKINLSDLLDVVGANSVTVITTFPDDIEALIEFNDFYKSVYTLSKKEKVTKSIFYQADSRYIAFSLTNLTDLFKLESSIDSMGYSTMYILPYSSDITELEISCNKFMRNIMDYESFLNFPLSVEDQWAVGIRCCHDDNDYICFSSSSSEKIIKAVEVSEEIEVLF